MSEDLFSALGMSWDRRIFAAPGQPGTIERAVKRFRKSLPQFVWDAAQLEGNPCTFPEVQTLLDGISVGGRKLSDTQQIMGLRDALAVVCDLVLAGRFKPDRSTACRLNGLIARDEALEWGHFRGEGTEMSNVTVNLGATSFAPKPTEKGAGNLVKAFDAGTRALQRLVDNPVERALALNLFMAREQLFFDGNKRTARTMMNGVLMSHGIDGISVPAVKRLAYNEAMARFYPAGDASEMMQFLLACFPDA